MRQKRAPAAALKKSLSLHFLWRRVCGRGRTSADARPEAVRSGL